MIKDVLQSILNVEIYPIVSLILFAISFITVSILVLLMDKKELARLSHLPLDNPEYFNSHKDTSGECFKSGGE